HYRTLLESIASDPTRRLSELAFLTEPERRQLLVEWNDTDARYPREKCIHTLFEEQVARTPYGVAVECEGKQITYAELNRRANAVASCLRQRGVGLDGRVGLCAERSLEMMIGMLGILKAGAAYVPVDITYPAERIAYVLRDAGVSLVLTHGDVEEPLAASDAARLPLKEAALSTGEERIPAEAPPACAAYVLYTSGSTGRPKGVVLSHEALVNLLWWQILRVPNPGRTLQFASIGFDASFHEIFLAWWTGGTVVIVSEEIRRDPPALLRFIDEARLQTINLSVAVLQQLAIVQLSQPELPKSLRVVLATAEQLQITEEIRAMFHRPNAPILYNHYGPTEAHVVTAFTLQGDTEGWSFLPPIGRPIANTQIYLLDHRLQPTPIGVPGELYIGGVCLARGYLNRPEMTAEKFVPDPFSSEPGARLYRAGDLARYLPDGNIEYLGRMDNQVKIRGFRVELGEIESVLLGHPAVREAVVLVREDAPGDKRLAAYVVGLPGVSVGELREALREKLPGHMVPSAFVMLDAFPLNSNGKVDRKALPKPDRGVSEPGSEYATPRNAREEILAEIWSQVLRVAQVGVHDSFFELGGHSLLATQLMARVREVFHVELPLRSLFESPTIAALGQKLASGAPDGKAIVDPPIRRAERDQALPLSFAQERLWFMDQLQPGNSLFNFPMALRLSGKLDIEALRRSLVTLQRRHEVLRTMFALDKGRPIQIIQDDPPAPLSLSELGDFPEGEQAEAVAQLVREEAQRPFDLAHGPIYRCHLIRLDPDTHVMVLTLHHIVADDNTATIFINELSALYRAEVTGGQVLLPELPIQYADYALWQRERFQQGRFQNQVDYWRRQLHDAPLILGIPTDYPRPSAPTFSRQSQRFLVPAPALQQIKHLCHGETITPFMFFLTAFQLLLSRSIGRKDILVGTDALNRDRPEIQNLIGFFINQLALRTDLSDCASFRQLLRRVRDVALEGYANQELPFNKLVEILRPVRDPEHPPFYQVKLTYTKGENSSIAFEGVDANWMSVDRGTAQLDLTL
ncbi:MAG TPA: amino acid adenylation domain-containing protein, partial [Chthonomonadaceae bacterium]|nr:amino acid adenylation domain-containing protein [Chthonomonadaceae bacterium]